jgi:hypothetical protein
MSWRGLSSICLTSNPRRGWMRLKRLQSISLVRWHAGSLLRDEVDGLQRGCRAKMSRT